MIGGQILIVFFGGPAFGTEPIPVLYWALSIALGAGSLVIGLLARLLPDSQLGQLMIRLDLLPNLDTLPRTRSVTNEKSKPYTFIRKIKGGRHRANENIYKLLHPEETKQSETIKGLFLLPAAGAQAIAGRSKKNKQRPQ